MKIDKEKLNKFIKVVIFCVICVIISRIFMFGTFKKVTGSLSLKEYINAFNQYDAGWFWGIANEGYHEEPVAHEAGDAANWAFFPLMPMVMRGIGSVLHAPTEIVGPIMNTIFFIAAMVVAWYYLEDTRSKKNAYLYVLLATLGMYSFYFSSMYTESIYLLCIVSFFYTMRKEKYIAMGIIGAFASSTRNTGVMLVFAVVIHVIMKYIKEKGENKFSIKDLFFYVIKNPKLILGTCLVPLGLFIYMLFLHLKVGDGLAFVHIQKAWGVEDIGILERLYKALSDIQSYGFYLALWAIWGIISVYHLFKNKRYDEAVLTLILVLIPLSVRIASIPRYLIRKLFPSSFYV